MSTKPKRKYGRIRSGAEAAADASNESIFDRFFVETARSVPIGTEPTGTQPIGLKPIDAITQKPTPPAISASIIVGLEPIGTQPIGSKPTIIELPDKKRGNPLITIHQIDLQAIFQPQRGYFQTFNDISDKLIAALRLSLTEQSVLSRLLRLSRGYHRLWCEVGYGALATACNISKEAAGDAVKRLLQRGVIELLNAGGGSGGTSCYLVLPFAPIGLEPTGTQPIGSKPVGAERRGIGSKPIPIPYTVGSEPTIKDNNDLNTNIKISGKHFDETTLEQEAQYYREHFAKYGDYKTLVTQISSVPEYDENTIGRLLLLLEDLR